MRTKLLLILVFVCGISLATVIYKRNHHQKKSAPALIHTLQHLGIIMDGNRRWAKERGLSPWLGHEAGIKPLKEAVKFCIKQNIPHLSLYTFSLENFKRPEKELHYLFDIIAQKLFKEELDGLIKQGVQLHFIGDRKKFPKKLVPIIESIEEKTANCTKLSLYFLFCYGGRQELTACTKKIARLVKDGKLSLDDITEETIKNNLWFPNIPDPDLVIRTGYRSRLSNFLPFQSTYSELCFLDCYWPDINEDVLEKTITKYTGTKRSFGK